MPSKLDRDVARRPAILPIASIIEGWLLPKASDISFLPESKMELMLADGWSTPVTALVKVDAFTSDGACETRRNI
jgi:hypothetical protein